MAEPKYRICSERDPSLVVEQMNTLNGYVPFGPMKAANDQFVQIMVRLDDPNAAAKRAWDYFSTSGAMVNLPNMDDAPTLMDAAFADVVETLNPNP